MKLQDIAENYQDTGKALTDAQLEMAFKAIKNEELDKAEIDDLAKQFEESETFGRTRGSAQFLLNRMHILVHGLAPYGETERRAETMFAIPQSMIEFADRKGIDTVYNIKNAREELKNRPVRIKRPEATNMMFDYYKANKNSLRKDVGEHREQIINDIMGGKSPEEAFAQFAL